MCLLFGQRKVKSHILEKDFPGSGDTTRTGGGIRYLHASPMNVYLSKMSHSFWTNYKKFTKKNLKIRPFVSYI